MAGFVPGTGLTYFLSIDGVSGSVTDPSHLGALAAYGYDVTITAPADATGSSAAPDGPDFGPLTVTMLDDSGLTDLFELLWSGKFVSGATLTARTTGATPYDAYKLDLGQVVVTKVEDQPGYLYTVTLDYRTVDLTTYGQAAGGALTPTSFGWDQATNSQADAVGNGAEPAVAATLSATYFLLIDGLDGASTDGKHRGWFDAIGFDLEATAPWSALGNNGAGVATFAPLTVFVSQDAGITDLLRLAASGKHVSSVRLEGIMVDSPATVYDLTLSDVVVTGVEDDNHAGPRLTLDYRAIELVTRGIANNTLVQTGSFAYDRAINGDPAAPLPSPVVGNLPGEGTPGNGTFSYFLALDGVAGNSTDASHPGALVVSFYDFDATRGGLPGGGSTNFSPLVVTVDGDTGLADVLALMTRHTHVSGVTLTVRTIGAQPFDAYKLDLEDVTVIDVRLNSGGYLLTLDYAKIDLTTRASTTTGAVVTEGSFGWDTVAMVTANAVGDGAESIVPATTPSKYFLLVDGVDGGSTDAAHVGWFELGGFSFSASLVGGAVDPKTLFAAFDHLDGLATLLQRAATGAPLRGVRVEGVTAGPNPVAVYDLTLSDVIVHGIIQESGGTSVTFDYARVELMTRGQTNAGSFVATGTFGFDRVTNTTYTPTSLPSLAPGNAPGEGTPVPGHDYRLILSGVPGEATDTNHFGSLLVKGYRFEVTQNASAVGGAGGASGSTFSTLSVTMADDTGLAAMLALLASGKHVPAASLMLPVTGQAFDAARFDLGDVTVQSVNDDASGIYWMTLGYRQIDLTTRTASGQSTVVTGAFGWDTSTRSVVDAPGDSAEPVVPPTTPARYFLLVDGVDGGATAAGHAGWFDVVSHRLVSTATASGGGPTFGALTVNFAQDTGLTDLVRRAATGAHLKGVRLEGVTADAAAQAVYDLTLSNVVIERIHDVGNNGFEVTFDYSRVEMITRGPTATGGTVQTGAFGFDVASGTSFTPTGLPPLAPSSVAAHDDAYVVTQDHALSIGAALGVLANDEAAAGATASLGAAPLHGTVQLATTGGFTYTPAAGYSGPDSFGYRVASGTAPASDGAVHIEVVPVAIGVSTTLNLVALTAEQQIASTYVAFFGRAADAAGFAFWVGEFNHGLPLQGATALFANIASSFGISTEAKALYPFLVTPFGASDGQIAAFLDTVYDNLFNRASDAAGLAYWTGQVRATLAAGQFVGSVLVNIMSGAQDTAAGKDITTLMGKVAVSLAYVQEQQEHNTVWSGASDIAAAAALLRDVTSDPQSVLVGVRNAELIIAAHA
jgi:type VI protein secretion system component Hcp